ncbi:DUF2790 domain-containing protein [Pseudomonas luteola]
MKMKGLIVAALVLASSSVLADQIPSDAASTPVVEHYTYSDHMDIKRVIDSPDITSFCGVRPVRMTYEDHNDKVHVMEYQVSGSGCNDN